ncbi:uncharacterized protein BDR25DRAFT_356063 [Lindgomyces ingoldianus]|uniref:Uncharacterized protein n=1 Tax=Lindgomyces ingoldianus TaxID=673940 RepID=A0ACB6QTG3_9PLEO|nr:uncharacterized protein BDR25DRAFT_356063 [Lindgomyces ingoldianus]KAF2469810.1 hypothetical protein BDR25DRAFT_356063 [Lindgomyces ingoldianus]
MPRAELEKKHEEMFRVDKYCPKLEESAPSGSPPSFGGKCNMPYKYTNYFRNSGRKINRSVSDKRKQFKWYLMQKRSKQPARSCIAPQYPRIDHLQVSNLGSEALKLRVLSHLAMLCIAGSKKRRGNTGADKLKSKYDIGHGICDWTQRTTGSHAGRNEFGMRAILGSLETPYMLNQS